MKSVCGHDFLYVHTNEVVFDYAICMQLCTGKKMRVGVVLDFPHSHSSVLLVLFKQCFLLAFHTSPAYSGFQTFGRSFCVGRLLSTNLATSELAGRALPLLKLRQISRQFQVEIAFLCAMLGFAFCVVARLTSLAFRIGAMWSFAVKTSETAS